MNPALDRDYGVLCGHPQVRRIYHTGRWIYVTVAVTDIGRANQPAPCGIDACAAVERMPPGDARAKERMRRQPKRSMDDKLLAALRHFFGSASIKQVAAKLHMPPEAVLAHVEAHPELYEMFEGARGSVRVRLRGGTA